VGHQPLALGLSHLHSEHCSRGGLHGYDNSRIKGLKGMSDSTEDEIQSDSQMAGVLPYLLAAMD
jgi:hypothetical protein